MPGLLPFLIALLIVEYTAGISAKLPLWGAWPNFTVVIIAGLLLWLALCASLAQVVTRSGRYRWLTRWDIAAQIVALVAFYLLCHLTGWAKAVPFSGVALLPFAVALTIHWWCLAPAVQAVTGHHWTRRGLMVHRLRFSVIPLLLPLILITDVMTWVSQYYPVTAGFWQRPAGLLLSLLGLEALMLGLFVFGPPIFAWLWGVKPMGAGPIRDDLQRACATMGVKVSKLLHWPVSGGRVYNAAVIGAIPQIRYVLFTDDLLRDLDQRQLLAVLGHELGHARHAHLWLYFVFTNVALALTELLREDFAQLVEKIPGSSELPAETRGLIAAIVLLVLIWRLLFGVISRACERQADLAGAELAGDCQVMQEALKSVAQLSGQPENAPSWRHYTIAQRVAFLEQVRQQPALAADHHRRVGSMRLSLILLLISLSLTLGYRYLLDPTYNVTPTVALARMATDDADLGSAFAAADERGDAAPLSRWLTSADEEDRLRLAQLHLLMIAAADGKAEDKNAPVVDDRIIYRYRHRLRAFVSVPLGKDKLNLTMDNTLAYGLVAGTDNPTKADLDLAKHLLPRLEKAVDERPDHAIYDTIASIHFRLGAFDSAKRSWSSALRFLGEDTDTGPDAATHAKSEALYRRRLEAAEKNLEAEKSHQPLLPLPLEWLEAPAASLPQQPTPAEPPATTPAGNPP